MRLTVDVALRTGWYADFNGDRLLCGRNDISVNPYVLAARPRT